MGSECYFSKRVVQRAWEYPSLPANRGFPPAHPRVFFLFLGLPNPQEFVNQHRAYPAFTRRNLFLRDEHKCQYCLKYFPPHDLSFDHVLPKTLGGKGTWDNVVTACGRCVGWSCCVYSSGGLCWVSAFVLSVVRSTCGKIKG